MNEVQSSKFKVQNFITAFKNFFSVLVNLYKKTVIVVLSLLVLLIIVLFFLTLKTRISPIAPADKFGPLSYDQPGIATAPALSAANTSFSFPKDTKTPNRVNVYRLMPSDEDANRDFFNRAIVSLGASESAVIKNFGDNKAYILWKDGFTFSGNLLNGSFSFVGKSPLAQPGSGDDAIKISAWNYLSSLEITNNIQNNPQASFLDYNNMEPESAKNTLLADLISLAYPFAADGIPMIGLGATEALLRLLVERKSGNLIRFDYALPKIDNNTKSSYVLLGLQELTKMPINRFRLLSLVENDDNKIANYSVPDVSSVNFNSVSLAYYLVAEKQDFLQPVFLLRGEAILNDGRKGLLTAILPAVRNINPSP